MNGGRFDFDDGGTYCGGWEEGKAHGHGVCTGPDSQGEYAGAWHYGFEVSGIYIWPSGSTYSGQWQNGKRHGLGVEQRGRWIYKGEWTQGFKGRYGRREAVNSGAHYLGTWSSGLHDGYGTEVYADGGSYRGQWFRGMRHGYGIRTSATHESAAKHRSRSNTHTSLTSLRSYCDDDNGGGADVPRSARDKKSAERQEMRGGFVLKARCAAPARRRRSLSERSLAVKRSILSNLRIKKQHSTGDIHQRVTSTGGSLRSSGSTISCASDDSGGDHRHHHHNLHDYDMTEEDKIEPSTIEVYKGEWKNDMRSGCGVCERSDGLRYAGEWLDNKKHGYGVTYFKDGTKEEGRYKNNVLVCSIRRKGIFFVRTSKVRDRVEANVEAAQRVDIALSRTMTAQERADAADEAAQRAKDDSDTARIYCAQFDPSFRQPGIDHIRQSRNRAGILQSSVYANHVSFESATSAGGLPPPPLQHYASQHHLFGGGGGGVAQQQSMSARSHPHHQQLPPHSYHQQQAAFFAQQQQQQQQQQQNHKPPQPQSAQQIMGNSTAAVFAQQQAAALNNPNLLLSSGQTPPQGSNSGTYFEGRPNNNAPTTLQQQQHQQSSHDPDATSTSGLFLQHQHSNDSMLNTAHNSQNAATVLPDRAIHSTTSHQNILMSNDSSAAGAIKEHANYAGSEAGASTSKLVGNSVGNKHHHQLQHQPQSTPTRPSGANRLGMRNRPDRCSTMSLSDDHFDQYTMKRLSGGPETAGDGTRTIFEEGGVSGMEPRLRRNRPSLIRQFEVNEANLNRRSTLASARDRIDPTVVTPLVDHRLAGATEIGGEHGSLPNLDELTGQEVLLKREEAARLASERRQEAQRQLEEAQRLHSNPLRYLYHPALRNWLAKWKVPLLLLVGNIVLLYYLMHLLTVERDQQRAHHHHHYNHHQHSNNKAEQQLEPPVD